MESGVDPRTILLLTFSRRAAVEMARRVEGIVAGLGERWARVAHSVLPWAGTFHGIGARLLREYAERCGMDPAFTILDREDAADLMNLVRDRAAPARERRALPAEEHLPRDLLGRGQH